MKKLFLILLMIVSFQSFGQNDKCLDITNNIITNIKGKVLSQNSDYIKCEFLPKYTLNDIKTVCDTIAIKTAKPSFNWRLNSDKNYEKEFIVNGKKLLFTIYENDKVLYFEFP